MTRGRFVTRRYAIFADWNKAMSDFKKGDTVRLKSGGPLMTIQKLDKFGAESIDGAVCVWFEGSKANHDTFDVAVLKLDDGSIRATRLA